MPTPAKDEKEIDVSKIDFPSNHITLGQIRANVEERYSDHRDLFQAISAVISNERMLAINAADELMLPDNGPFNKGYARRAKEAAAEKLIAAYGKVGVGEELAKQYIRDIERDAIALVPGRKQG